MFHRALEPVPTAWVVGDEVYGRNPGLRTYLEQHRIGYVMAIASTDRPAAPRGLLAVKEPAVLVPEQTWQKFSVGTGAKGERFYDWALIDDVGDVLGGGGSASGGVLDQASTGGLLCGRPLLRDVH